MTLFLNLCMSTGTFDVQHCDVHTDHTSYILVECTFAINSTAPGFVLIQDEHSQYTINTTLQRHEGDVSKGSVNITDLPTGEYRVTVYDEMEDYLNNMTLAYLHEILQVAASINYYSTPTVLKYSGECIALYILLTMTIYDQNFLLTSDEDLHQNFN